VDVPQWTFSESVPQAEQCEHAFTCGWDAKMLQSYSKRVKLLPLFLYEHVHVAWSCLYTQTWRDPVSTRKYGVILALYAHNMALSCLYMHTRRDPVSTRKHGVILALYAHNMALSCFYTQTLRDPVSTCTSGVILCLYAHNMALSCPYTHNMAWSVSTRTHSLILAQTYKQFYRRFAVFE
jgi:hypothetical protein